MEKLGELRREIEAVRKELNVAAALDIRAEECYRLSCQLDSLIEDYMRCTKENRLQKCG